MHLRDYAYLTRSVYSIFSMYLLNVLIDFRNWKASAQEINLNVWEFILALLFILVMLGMILFFTRIKPA